MTSAEFEILTVLSRYLHAIDTRDAVAVGECFAVQARATYAGPGEAESREQIVKMLGEAGAFGDQKWGSSMHALANWRIELTGTDEARSSIIVEAVLADMPRGSGRAQRRGLCYTDELKRQDGVWRITARRHQLLWSHPVEGAVIPQPAGH